MKLPKQNCGIRRKGFCTVTDDQFLSMQIKTYEAARGVTPSNAWCERVCQRVRREMSEEAFQLCLAGCRLN
jgi:hypothetical protein